MRTLKLFSVITAFMLISSSLFAQKDNVRFKETSFKVWGNCEMCKTTIEKAAKSAGATEAEWSPETKMITVKYVVDNSTSLDKIQSTIASKGYDTEAFKGSDAAYKKLHACCQYERKANTVKAAADKKEASCCSKDKDKCKDDCKKDHE